MYSHENIPQGTDHPLMEPTHAISHRLEPFGLEFLMIQIKTKLILFYQDFTSDPSSNLWAMPPAHISSSRLHLSHPTIMWHKNFPFPALSRIESKILLALTTPRLRRKITKIYILSAGLSHTSFKSIISFKPKDHPELRRAINNDKKSGFMSSVFVSSIFLLCRHGISLYFTSHRNVIPFAACICV